MIQVLAEVLTFLVLLLTELNRKEGRQGEKENHLSIFSCKLGPCILSFLNVSIEHSIPQDSLLRNI